MASDLHWQRIKHDDLAFDSTGPIADLAVFNFWNWAFRDLCDDDVKGIYIEWVIGKMLGIEGERRISWANSDLITLDGIRIEIKSTSYWQSWKLMDEHGKIKKAPEKGNPLKADNEIKFGGLKAKDSLGKDQWGGESAYKSHLYLFCFQKEKDYFRWNALDMDQWEFYVLKREDLERLNVKTITLSRLKKITSKLNSASLKETVLNLMEDIRRTTRFDSSVPE